MAIREDNAHHQEIIDTIEWAYETKDERKLLGYMGSRADIDYSSDLNLPLQLVCRYGFDAALEIMLMDSRCDPSDCDNNALLEACKEGHYKVVRRLLRDMRVDPAAEHNKSLLTAILYNRTQVVELLLRDDRIDPSAPDNAPLIVACEMGYSEIVSMLLLNLHVDPSANSNAALIWASGKGHASVVEILCDDPRTDISDWHPDADKWCVHTSDFLPSARSFSVKTSDYLSMMPVESSSSGNSDDEMFEFEGAGDIRGAVFENDITGSFERSNTALQWAIRNGHDDVVKFFLLQYGPAVPFTLQKMLSFCLVRERDMETMLMNMFGTVRSSDRSSRIFIEEFEYE
jgi:ankyrin repeat protein